MSTDTLAVPPCTDVLDPLHHPDPARVADAAAMEQLLRCWVRETAVTVPRGPVLRLDLPVSGWHLDVPVLHRSTCGWHRLGVPRFPNGAEADAATVAALLMREAAAARGAPPFAGADMVARVLDSARHVAIFLAARRAAPDDAPGTSPFLSAEQASLFGHPLHPVPKSREGVADHERATISPELRGSFPLHWFAVHRSVLSSDSALDRSAEDLLASLAGGDVAPPPGTVAVPVHPWQAHEVVHRPGVQALIDQGLLHDLGPAGLPWYPTASVRTLYRPDAPFMVKSALSLRITNACRNILREELEAAVWFHRLLGAGLGAQLQEAYPAFSLVSDPAWIAVDVPGDQSRGGGLETLLRHNPFGPAARAVSVSSLVTPRPDLGRSAVGSLVHALAERTARPVGDIAAEWFERYLHAVAAPLVWLHATHGVGLEAHLQNTLVTIDDQGWPIRGWCRDLQGYYLASSGVDALGARSVPPPPDTLVFPDHFVLERVGSYVGAGNLFAVIGAFGAEGLAEEESLLRVLRRMLQRCARHHEDGLASMLLDQPSLRCKANLLTCAEGRDENLLDYEEQAVYVELPNPLAGVR
jgi:siderophore synthetase component